MYTLDDALGFAAALCVLFTFCMKSMGSLRVLGLLSNVLFIAYASRVGLFPVLVLHVLLLPINLVYLLRAGAKCSVAKDRSSATRRSPKDQHEFSPIR